MRILHTHIESSKLCNTIFTARHIGRPLSASDPHEHRLGAHTALIQVEGNMHPQPCRVRHRIHQVRKGMAPRRLECEVVALAKERARVRRRWAGLQRFCHLPSAYHGSNDKDEITTCNDKTDE